MRGGNAPRRRSWRAEEATHFRILRTAPRSTWQVPPRQRRGAPCASRGAAALLRARRRARARWRTRRWARRRQGRARRQGETAQQGGSAQRPAARAASARAGVSLPECTGWLRHCGALQGAAPVGWIRKMTTFAWAHGGNVGHWVCARAVGASRGQEDISTSRSTAHHGRGGDGFHG